jgi:hypothetical protein
MAAEMPSAIREREVMGGSSFFEVFESDVCRFPSRRSRLLVRYRRFCGVTNS